MLTPVGVTTSNYINALKADSPVHVKMTFTAQGVVLTDQDVDISSGLTMNDILNGDIDLTFGRAVMKQLTIGIINSNRVSGLIWTDEFDLELGVDIGVNTYYVKIGTFIGEKPNNINNVQIINFTAYDYMQKFDGLADDYWEGITFPATVESIYHGLCDYVGVGYVSGDELPYIMNRTFTTAPAQLQGYTCRDLLAWLAEACGCYAKINADGNCKMVWYTDHSSSLAFALDDEFHIETADLNTGLTWDEFDQYYWDDADKLQWNDVCSYEEAYAIDCIQVKQLGADIDVCYPMEPDGNVYMIVENPFLSVESADDIQYYIKPLFDRLVAHGGHLPMEVQCVGNYLVETGDIISVDVDGVNTLYSPVYTRTFKWKGSCTDTYETTGNVERQKVSSENRAKLVSRNNIRFVAKDLYYNIQSGIDIEPEGITIDGNKFIKMKSGSEIDIESGGDLNIKTGGKVSMQNGNFNIDQNGNVSFNGSAEISSGKSLAIKSGGALSVDSGNFSIDSSGNVNFKGSAEILSNKNLKIKSGGTLDVESGGKIDVLSGGNLDVESGSNMTVKSGGNLKVNSGGNIDINGTGNLKLTGATVEIKSGSTFDVDATNFKISSQNKYFESADWRLNNNGLLGGLYTGSTRDGSIAIGNPERFTDSDASSTDVLGVTGGFAGSGNNKVGYYYFRIRYIDSSAEQLNIKVGKGVVISTYTKDKNGNYTYNGGTLGEQSGKWDVWGKTIRYETLTQTSSKDIKHDIKPIKSVGNKLDSLAPVSFVYDSDKNETIHFGLIYEDAINVIPEICTNNEADKAINYVELIPMLIKEIQDLRSRVKTLEDKLNERGDT